MLGGEDPGAPKGPTGMTWTSAPAATDPKLPENHLACPCPRRPGPAPHFKHPFLSLSCQLLLLHSETPPRSPSCITSSRKPSLCSRGGTSFLQSWSQHLRPTSPDALHTEEQTLLGWSTTLALGAEGVCLWAASGLALHCCGRVGCRGWSSLPVPPAQGMRLCSGRSRGTGPRTGPR